MFGNLIDGSGGDQFIGAKLPGLFHASGFADVRTTGAFEVFAWPAGARSLVGLFTSYYLLPPIAQKAIQLGLATQEELTQLVEALPAWAEQRDALAVIPWFETLGWKRWRSPIPRLMQSGSPRPRRGLGVVSAWGRSWLV